MSSLVHTSYGQSLTLFQIGLKMRYMKRKVELSEIPELRKKYGGKVRAKASIRFPKELRAELEDLADKEGYGFNFTETLIALADFWIEQERGKAK